MSEGSDERKAYLESLREFAQQMATLDPLLPMDGEDEGTRDGLVRRLHYRLDLACVKGGAVGEEALIERINTLIADVEYWKRNYMVMAKRCSQLWIANEVCRAQASAHDATEPEGTGAADNGEEAAETQAIDSEIDAAAVAQVIAHGKHLMANGMPREGRRWGG